MSEAPPSPSPPRPAIVVAADVPHLVAAAADAIAAAAGRALAARGRFRIALAGGSTPRALYLVLAPRIDWTRTDVFLGDERAVPPDHPESNYRMIRESLLDPGHVPAANVRRWRTEDPDLEAAARDYAQALAAGGPPVLDLALLGLGPDGHTASLFPGTSGLVETERLAVAVDVPALETRRLTVTYPVLLGAGEVAFLVTGADKAAALAAVVRPGSDLPAARVVQRSGPVTIFCDASAARALGPRP